MTKWCSTYWEITVAHYSRFVWWWFKMCDVTLEILGRGGGLVVSKASSWSRGHNFDLASYHPLVLKLFNVSKVSQVALKMRIKRLQTLHNTVQPSAVAGFASINAVDSMLLKNYQSNLFSQPAIRSRYHSLLLMTSQIFPRKIKCSKYLHPQVRSFHCSQLCLHVTCPGWSVPTDMFGWFNDWNI